MLRVALHLQGEKKKMVESFIGAPEGNLIIASSLVSLWVGAAGFEDENIWR